MISSSKMFEVMITGTHSVFVPYAHAKPFLDAKQTRVALSAFYNGQTLQFHGKLHLRNDEVYISFGKRYQNLLGVTPSEPFLLQLHEDTSAYGVEVPEAFSAVLETDADAFTLFEALTMGKKRSLIYYISRFKSTQTQVDKAIIICENLKLGITEMKQLIKPQY